MSQFINIEDCMHWCSEDKTVSYIFIDNYILKVGSSDTIEFMVFLYYNIAR